MPGSESATSSTSGQRNANAATARTFGHSPLFADRRQFIEVPPQNIRSNSFQQPFGPFAVDASTNRMWQWPIPFSPPAADLFSSVLPMQQRVLRPWQCFNIASDTAAFPSFRTNASVAAAPYPLFPTLQFPANGQQSCPTRVESRPHSTRHSRRYRFRLQNEYTQRFGPIWGTLLACEQSAMAFILFEFCWKQWPTLIIIRFSIWPKRGTIARAFSYFYSFEFTENIYFSGISHEICMGGA